WLLVTGGYELGLTHGDYLMDSPTKAKLNLLHLYLKNLPNSIPFVDPGGMSQYGFDFFVVDDEDVEDKGPVGAINHQLEIQLGHQNNGPILFAEQGPSLCKLTGLFEIPILHKWLDDLIAAAENAYSSTNTKLPEVTLDQAIDVPADCTYVDTQLCQQSNEVLSNKALGPAIDSTVQMKVLGQHRVEVSPSAGMKKYDGNGMLAAVAVKEGRKKQKETSDYHIMKFIVCCRIPPTVVDSAEWKEMVAVLNPHYQPLSSTTFTEKLIVNEAAKITAAINKILLGCQNLTITFDGGKHTFCMELDDASQLSHTAKYILEVLEHIGCHLLNLAIKDICLLPEFGEIISQIWSILAFMSCSTYSMEHFHHQHAHLGICWGLEYIGETCFGTIYWSALSMQHGLPAFAALAESNIDIMGYNALFQPGGQKILFELALSKLLQVTGPWAKGLQVLEAADVTADHIYHIYYIFLGIMSQLEEDFCKNEFSLGWNTIEDIYRIANNQFNELVNETPQLHDLYITAFVCNPAVPTIVISQTTEASITCSKKPPQGMVECAGLALQCILKHEYGDTVSMKQEVE
ncbi:hypothetical protein EV401DRAFT_1896351, partial [Pisolithus croceorrhizus]